ncbi:MAG: PEP-utilizing enzyme [Thermodesulfobacteriaceae bacterium]|nr:PEP-utilizing enzyme [Thermodesulfobacteriaceae bacterium]
MVEREFEKFTSKALLANLARTFVKEVYYDPKYSIFLQIFEKFPALKSQIETLLKEIFHPYKNNLLVLEEFRNFFIRNLPFLIRHPYKIQGYWLIFDLLFKFFEENRQINIKTSETIFSILDRTLDIIFEKDFEEFSQVLKEVLKAVSNLPLVYFLNFLENYYSFKKLIKKLNRFKLDEELNDICIYLLKRAYNLTYELWKKLVEGEVENLLKPLENKVSKVLNFSFSYFNRLAEALEKNQFNLEVLLQYPDHLDLLKELKEIIYEINKLDDSVFSDEKRLLFLFKLIENPGLNLIHEELIREVNRILIILIESKIFKNLEEFLTKFFRILKENLNLYPSTALECIKNIGICILNKKDVYLTELLINEIVKFGFQPPKIEGIDETWRIKQNPNHLLNIKVWLEIFETNPEWCSSLLSALTLNLKLYGVSIRDTDLFQREVTKLLNSTIKPVYNLVKQFCKCLPVYYNEIGAEGLIRDLSTEIDELFQRSDTLIHFLRKFIHIENSSLAISFIKDILKFWYTLDENFIKSYIPDVLLEKILKEDRDYYIPIYNILHSLLKDLNLENLEILLEKDIDYIKEKLEQVEGEEIYKKKLYLLIYLYKLEYQKYYGMLNDIKMFVNQYKQAGFEFVQEIESLVESKISVYNKLDKILFWLNELKDKIILSSEKFTPVEEIILKRHVAVDIPSMYGRYKEKKFDALGLTFRLEYLANKYFEEIVDNFELSIITKLSFFEILKILKIFKKALVIDGISSQKFNLYLKLLENSLKSYPLSYYQYLDIFKGLIDGVQHIVKSYYINPYLKVFPLIFSNLDSENLCFKYKQYLDKLNPEERYFYISEIIIREIIGSGFALKYLDKFLRKVYQLLSDYIDKFDKRDLNLLMSYDKRKTISFIHQPNFLVSDLIYLGNKGYNLLLLSRDEKVKNFKIPYGFILTTEIFRCYELMKRYPELEEDYKNTLKEAIRVLEVLTGKKYGCVNNSLILSVRSGSAISMPGMMSSILNVGLNLDLVKGLAEKTQNLWFAWDTYRRFVQSWAMAYGVNRDFFNNLMREHKRKYGVKMKREFTGEQMQELALLYREKVLEQGIEISDDPWEQLFKSIELILDSWYNNKANTYREIMQIAEEWGTAVIVQQMVFGNKGPMAGTGVSFTTSPIGKFPRVVLWGDYTTHNQGEDIVSGLVNTYPISIEQRKWEEREGPSLEEAFPEIYKSLLDLAYYLVYEKDWGHQEIEFTFESEKSEDLYILQVRDIILREEKMVPFVKKEVLSDLEYIGKGIGVSGGLLSGRVVFNLQDIEVLKLQGEPLILLRYDTVPDNIREISLVDGILTARGGQTSHAAIVASRLGKVCVVGCEKLSINDLQKEARIEGITLKLGDWITINGLNGHIFKGRLSECKI